VRCPVGVDLTVVAVTVPPAVRLRLREIGLRAGTTLRVTHRAAFGGRVVAVGSTRLAVDGATAARIEVR
jgi:ferrous iron transport protein A